MFQFILSINSVHIISPLDHVMSGTCGADWYTLTAQLEDVLLLRLRHCIFLLFHVNTLYRLLLWLHHQHLFQYYQAYLLCFRGMNRVSSAQLSKEDTQICNGWAWLLGEKDSSHNSKLKAGHEGSQTEFFCPYLKGFGGPSDSPNGWISSSYTLVHLWLGVCESA